MAWPQSISFRKSARRSTGWGIVRLAIHLVVPSGPLDRTRATGPDFRATSQARVWLAFCHSPGRCGSLPVWALAVAGAFRPFGLGSRFSRSCRWRLLIPPLVAILFRSLRSSRVAALLDAISASWLVGLQV